MSALSNSAFLLKKKNVLGVHSKCSILAKCGRKRNILSFALLSDVTKKNREGRDKGEGTEEEKVQN